MLLLWVLCIVLAVAVIVLSVKNHLLKKSMREIYTDFENCLSEDTNVQITVSSGDKTVARLAKAINLQLTKLRKIKQQYSDGDRELKEAITNISHDLRTPLTAICGYLDLLEKQNHSEDTGRYIEQIRNRSEVLKQLTEELFRYSIISSTPELSYEKVNLCRVVDTARKSTGLGLAIAKTLVEKMNGKIEADIKNGKLNIVICFPENMGEN